MTIFYCIRIPSLLSEDLGAPAVDHLIPFRGKSIYPEDVCSIAREIEDKVGWDHGSLDVILLDMVDVSVPYLPKIFRLEIGDNWCYAMPEGPGSPLELN